MWQKAKRSPTPTPYGLYHSSDALLKEIKAMVVRHPDTLTSFGQHGRELITTEVALHLLSVLAEECSMQSMDLMSLHKLLDNLVIKKTVHNWTAAFLTLFKLGTLRLRDAHFAPSTDLRKWVPFGDKVRWKKPCRRDQGQHGWT